MRDELLNGEIFYSLREAQIIIEEWRKHYNTKRPHSAMGYRPPAPETIVQMDQRPIMHKKSNGTAQVGLIGAAATTSGIRSASMHFFRTSLTKIRAAGSAWGNFP